MSIYQGNKKVLGGVSNIEENKVKEIIDNERPITTTINSSSTDSEIPSAKAVFNSTIGESILSTDKYGNDMLSYPCGLYRFGLDTVVRSMVNTPCNISGVLLVTSQQSDPERNITTDTKVYREYAYIDYNGNAYIRALRTGDTAGVITVDSGWQKVCTTKVPDVATTVTTFENADVSGYVKYYVKNGICHVTFWPVQSTSTGTGKKLLSNMPIPLGDDTGTALFHANGDGTSTAFSYVNSNGNLYAHFYKANTASFGTFSYPVLES